MFRAVAWVIIAVASAASASEVSSSEQAEFFQANRYLSEQSNARSCDAFNEFLKKHPESALAREAKVKRARACYAVGRDIQQGTSDLHEIAKSGNDFAHALADLVLAARGETYVAGHPRGRIDLAISELYTIARTDSGRTRDEARSLCLMQCLQQLNQLTYDVTGLNAVYEKIISLDPSATQRAQADLLRGRAYLNSGRPELVKTGDSILREVGAGNTEWADDALYDLGMRAENQQDYAAALALFEQIVSRFNGTTSNLRESARTQSAAIKAPVLSASVSYIELPGEKPELSLQTRNLGEVQVTVRRVDPLRAAPESLLNGGGECADFGRDDGVVKRFTVDAHPTKPYTYVNLTPKLEVSAAGVYVVDASSGAKHACAGVIVSSLASVLKVSNRSAAVYVADAMTGVAVKHAKVALALRLEQTSFEKFEGETGDDGVALIPLSVNKRIAEVVAWAKKDDAFAFARGYGNGYYGEPQREYLAYTLTDRPLYKPGENVGIKVFLRSRTEGPSTPLVGKPLHLRVYDPQYRELKSFDVVTSAFGTAEAEVALGKEATLGLYRLSIESEGISVQQREATFRVEEYKPPEFVVSVEPSGAPKPGEPVKVHVVASRYSGGPVANAQGRAVITQSGYYHEWKPWPDETTEDVWSGYAYRNRRPYDYEMRDYGRRPYPYLQQQLRELTLTFKTGADGSADIEIPKAPDSADHSYAIQVFVTDSSRREVSGSGTVNVSSAPYFVDVRTDRYLYKPGEPVKVSVRSEDANGRPMSPKVDLVLLRVKEDNTTTEILRRTVELKAGTAEASLDGDAIGAVRIEARNVGAKDTDPLLAQTDVWLTNEAKPITPPGSSFAVYTDRAPLHVGGTVRALVVAPTSGGDVFFTVAGNELYVAKGYSLQGRARFIELPLTAEMTPNAWLFVDRFENSYLYQSQAYIQVGGTDNQLTVDVSHQSDVVEPGQPQTATLRAHADGFSGEVEYAVTSFDESISAIEQMPTDFVSYFARRPQQLRVTTASTMQFRSFRPPKQPRQQVQPTTQSQPADEEDRIAGGAVADTAKKEAMAPAEEKTMSGPARAAPKAKAGLKDDAEAQSGGGEAPVKVRTNFSSLALWLPSKRASGATTVSLNVPDSLTRFRTVAFAVTKGPQLGMGSSTFRTEKPLMVRLEAPRFFTERDEVTLSALVSNRLGQPASVMVSFNASGLKPLDRTTRVVDVPAGGDARVDARYAVVEPGEVTVQVTAKGGGKADAMAMKLLANVHGAAQRKAFSGRISDSVSMKMKLPELRNASGTRFELTVSPSLLSVMVDALPYLAQYPYGCVEQTLSRFVPASIAEKAARDMNLPKDRIPADLPLMVDSGLQRLYGFQHSDGGWGWWKDDATNRWMSAYVVYGLSLAKDAGARVDPRVLQRGREYLVSSLGSALDNPEEHAWMDYALASTGGAPKAGLDKDFERRSRLSRRGRALLALSLITQNDPRARIAVENLDDILTAVKDRAELSVGDANDAWSTSEAIEATAYTLMALNRYDPKSPYVKLLTDFLVLRRNGGKWRSTRDTAFALYALSDLARRENAGKSAGTFIVEVNGKVQGRINFSHGGLTMPPPLVLSDSAFTPGENVITLKRDGANITGYFSALFDVYNRDENVHGVGNDVKVSRHYTLIGKPSARSERVTAEAEYGMPVESGVRVRVDLEVKANKAMQYLMIEDLKPAGFEAVSQKSGRELCNYSCANAELRTDRVAFFFTDIPAGVTKVSYELRAEVPGKFHALPARVEAMYAPELQATSDEMRFQIFDVPEATEKGVASDAVP